MDFVVTNGPQYKACNTVLNVSIPGGTTFINASENGSMSGNTVPWNFGDLNPGDTRKVSLTVRATQPCSIKAVANVTAYCATACSDCCCTIKGIPAIAMCAEDLCNPVEVGGKTTHRVTVTNQGSAAINDVAIEVNLPGTQKYINSIGPSAASASGNRLTFGQIALAPGGKAVWDIQVEALEPATAAPRSSSAAACWEVR